MRPVAWIGAPMALLLTGFAGAALADVMVTSDDVIYDVTCSPDGAILTPQAGGDTLYLGRSCDAFADSVGTGTWGWANGGVIAEFGDMFFGFPRQEVACPDDGPQPDLISCGL